jgi:hypothetical protein
MRLRVPLSLMWNAGEIAFPQSAKRKPSLRVNSVIRSVTCDECYQCAYIRIGFLNRCSTKRSSTGGLMRRRAARFILWGVSNTAAPASANLGIDLKAPN